MNVEKKTFFFLDFIFVHAHAVSDEDIFEDFEDLETGEVHKADDNEHSEGEGQGDENDEGEQSKTGREEDRLEKKKKQKAAFDAMYP